MDHHPYIPDTIFQKKAFKQIYIKRDEIVKKKRADIGTVGSALRTPNDIAQLVHEFRQNAFFRTFPLEIMQQIAKRLETKFYHTSQIIINKNERPLSAFLLYKGRVNVIANDEVVRTLHENSILIKEALQEETEEPKP